MDKGFQLVICECGECEGSGNFFDGIFGEMGVLVLKLFDFLVVERDVFGFTGAHRQCEVVIGVVPFDAPPSSITECRLNAHRSITAAIGESTDTDGSRFRVQDRDTDTGCRGADKETTPFRKPLVFQDRIATRAALCKSVVDHRCLFSEPFCDHIRIATSGAEHINVMTVSECEFYRFY